MDTLVAIGAALIALAAVACIGVALRVRRRAAGGGSAGTGSPGAQARLAEVRAEATATVARARDEAVARRSATLDELAERRAALLSLEQPLSDAADALAERRQRLDERRAALAERRATLEEQREAVQSEREAVEARLGELAGIDRSEAAASVLARAENELGADHPGRVARTVTSRLGDVTPAARSQLVGAMQRMAGSHIDTAPRGATLMLEGLDPEQRERLLSALSVVAGDTATELGVDPERNSASLRGLDPVGREVARQASIEVLERHLSAEQVPPLLLATRGALGRRLVELGERAMWEMRQEGRPELAELLGALHHRFSYGQNALLHCRETGHLCTMLAAELGMDPDEARSAGLLHDIGKAVDHDVEGSHAIIGGELLSVLGADSGIVHAVKAHHFDEEPSTDLAMLTICADAISASRPGARRDTLTTYLQRLEQLQQIAGRHRGVERAFPMQAGREVRVSVRPQAVPDADVPSLCAEIAREIEAEMQYPGVIKVMVIRETAASATAS